MREHHDLPTNNKSVPKVLQYHSCLDDNIIVLFLCEYYGILFVISFFEMVFATSLTDGGNIPLIELLSGFCFKKKRTCLITLKKFEDYI